MLKDEILSEVFNIPQSLDMTSQKILETLPSLLSLREAISWNHFFHVFNLRFDSRSGRHGLLMDVGAHHGNASKAILSVLGQAG